MNKNQIPFYLTVISIFILIISPNLLSDGMFMDGVLYAIVSNNLANSQGTLWHLNMQPVDPVFYAHPPLGFLMQSVLYKFFGNSILIERVYSILTFIITAFIIVKIWNSIVLKKGNNRSWLPLGFWFIIPLVSWAASNNMLENTMMIFTSLSVLCIILSLKSYHFLYLFLAGISLFAAFMTKGLVGLFPLSLIFWLFVFSKQVTFKRFVVDLFFTTAVMVLPFIILIIVSQDAKEFFSIYFQTQVFKSIVSVQTVANRFYIVGQLLKELIIVLSLLLILFLVTRKRTSYTPINKWTMIFLFLGLSGILPIMITLKQRGFYMLPSFPFLAIAAALFVDNGVNYLINKINYTHIRFRVFKYVSIFLFVTGFVLIGLNVNRIGRDKNKIEDVYAMMKIVPPHTTISLSTELHTDWSLHAYFGRYADIGLDSKNLNHKFLIIKKGDNFPLSKTHSRIGINLNEYELYENQKATTQAD
ncbi:MAG: hypothetical protein GX612_00705 [Bacteroidales bacterium]|jgi:4-amino-4-deoxy-L-arabinose transferase-like glycosyltransferase|nr:hypothetical protein [Bacteroidales bacterium]